MIINPSTHFKYDAMTANRIKFPDLYEIEYCMDKKDMAMFISDLYDFSYKVFDVVRGMIAPGRYIDFLISADEPDGVNGISISDNTIIIYLYKIIKNTYITTICEYIIYIICHELYHCVLKQPEYNSNKDIIEKQTDYMAINFIVNNRDTLEKALYININIIAVKSLLFIDDDDESIFLKDISGIKEHESLRDIWLNILSNYDEYILNYDIVEGLDRSSDVNITVVAQFDGAENDYTYEDIIKRDGVFLPPGSKITSVRLLLEGSLSLRDNRAKSQSSKLKILYREYEEESRMHIILVYTQERTPFFIKPV